jgi:hypothetical protein
MILFHLQRLYSVKCDMKVVMTSMKLLSQYLSEVHEESHNSLRMTFSPSKILTGHLSNTD